MKQFFRITAALLAAAFLLALTGCGSSSSAPSFTWFVDTIPANLDPQVASAAPDVIACENLYSGLVRKKADGEIVPDLSESWTVSSDGKTYTFQIKDGLTYKAVKGASTDHTITAEDFVFAFRRIFQPQTNSPYAVEFAALENSAAVLAGTADASTLGVSAAGPLTLVFRLSEKDDNFLAKLTLPGAMPCDEAFFESTRGTYGLTAKTTLSSGSFYLYNWTASGLFLRRDVSSPMIGSLRLVQNTGSTGKSAAQLIADEKCSAALDDTGEDTSLQSVDYSDTTWALLFNSAEDSVFADQELRQALAGIARENVDVPSSGLYTAAEGLVPTGLSVDGIDYRKSVRNPLPTITDPRTLYLNARQGMASSDFSGVTILLPKEAGLTELAEQINGAWQKDCSLFFSVEEVPQEEFDKRLAAGSYTIALAPIRAEGGSVYQMLQQFTAEGGGLTGCEIAYELALQGKDVTIVEMKDDLVSQKGVCLANSSYLREWFAWKQVPVYLETTLREVKDGSIVCAAKDGSSVEIPCDTVISSAGYISTPLVEEKGHKNVQLVGDCLRVGNLRSVVWRAYEAAMKI